VSAVAAAVPAMVHASGLDGPPVLLVHGFGADRLSWVANQHALSEAGRIYVLDLPGHGDSPLAGSAGLDALAEAVEQTIEASGLGPLHLVGHSLGGAVAIALAAARPDRVRSLALIAPAGLGQGMDERFLSEYPQCDSIETMEALLRRLVVRPRLISRQLAARALDQLERPGARRGLSAIARELQRIDQAVGPAIEKIAASSLPRLVLWGARDAIIPLDADRLLRFGADSLMLPDAAHMPHVESPRAVNDRLKRGLSAESR
jgi:pimeloyl-ACP methyl ester carboxylesterase